MDLYLIRHAQSLNNAQPPELRVPDPSLTELGHEQARRIAQHGAGLGLARLITSPFRRALETTEHIRLATGLVPEVRIPLHETGGCVSGIEPVSMIGCPGMTHSEIRDEFPGYQLDADIDGQGWWRSQPYETPQQVRQRAARLLAHTRTEFGHTGARVAFVTHGDFGLLFLSCFHPLPLVLFYNASVTHVRITPDSAQLVDYNAVPHLPEQMLSW